SVEAGFDCRRECVANRGDLRLGEHNPWSQRAIGTRIDPRVPAEDHIRRDAALVLPHMREQRPAVRVADCEEPVVTRYPQRVVDLHETPRLESDFFQANVPRGWASTD